MNPQSLLIAALVYGLGLPLLSAALGVALAFLVLWVTS